MFVGGGTTGHMVTRSSVTWHQMKQGWNELKHIHRAGPARVLEHVQSLFVTDKARVFFHVDVVVLETVQLLGDSSDMVLTQEGPPMRPRVPVCWLTGTAAPGPTVLPELDGVLRVLLLSVQQELLCLQTTGQSHEDTVHVVALPWGLGRRLEQQHVVRVGEAQGHAGGHLHARVEQSDKLEAVLHTWTTPS